MYASMREEMTTPDGRVSGVLYRCLNTMIRQIDQFRPTHFLCIFDHGRSSYRVDKYPEYKANRDEDDSPEKQERKERFLVELNNWQEAMDAMFLSFISKKKIEADDIIATAAEQYPGQKLVVSSDHDLLQLVSPSCRVHKTAQSRNQESVTFTEGKVREKFDMTPEDLIHLWALIGDKGDNIIGLHRVGIKTATKKLKENNFDFEATVDALAKTPEDKERVMLNVDLIRLHPELYTELPNFNDLEIDYSLFRQDLVKFSEGWGFQSFISRVNGNKILST